MDNQYKGVKFKVVKVDNKNPANIDISEIVEWAKIYHSKNLAPLYETGSYGNLSFRIKTGEKPFYITASHTALNSNLNLRNFVQVSDCDLENNIVYTAGNGEPSSETMLHYAIYRARPEINCILHGHCDKIMSMSDKLQLVETERSAPYGTPQLVQEVIKIVNEADFLIIKEHGFLSLGDSINSAGKLSLDILNKCSSNIVAT